MLAAVGLFVAHRSEGQELARLVARAQPAWLLLGAQLRFEPLGHTLDLVANRHPG